MFINPIHCLCRKQKLPFWAAYMENCKKITMSFLMIYFPYKTWRDNINSY